MASSGTELDDGCSWLRRCSILYQRGIYPPESFDRQKKYGLAMMVTSDEGLTKYLSSVLKQMSGTNHPAPVLKQECAVTIHSRHSRP